VRAFHNQYKSEIQGFAYPAHWYATWLDGDSTPNSDGFYSARCPAHDDAIASLSLKDLSCGRLYLRCWKGCSYAAIRAALAALERDGKFNAKRIPDATSATPKVELWPVALRIINETVPFAGSPADLGFMRKHRGIVTDSLMLRYHPALYHKRSGRTLPAMVAVLQDVTGAACAIHRTFLDPITGNKADVKPVRMALCPIAGAAVRLHQVMPGHALLIGEGIETSLAAGIIHGLPAWSALSWPGLVDLILPDGITSLVIAGDNDPIGRAAVEKLRARVLRRNPTVQVRQVFPAADFKDFNDQLIRKVRARE
jgi:hypothetical protein